MAATGILKEWFRRRAPVPEGTPPVALPKPSPPAWFEIQGAPVVERNRLFVISVGLVAILAILCATLFVLLPLKTVVPFMLERSDNGAVSASNVLVQRFEPDEAEKRYFLAQWARQILTLDPHLTPTYLAQAYGLTRGKASVEFTDWVRHSEPLTELRKDPSLTRTVSVSSVSLIEDEVALVRVVTERRNGANPMARLEKFFLTLHFATVAPRREEDILSNPAGLFITHFLVGPDLEK